MPVLLIGSVAIALLIIMTLGRTNSTVANGSLRDQLSSHPSIGRDRTIDMTFSFLQVIDPTTIRIRNILVKHKNRDPRYFMADFNVHANGLRLINIDIEGANQRKYLLRHAAINVDKSKNDWAGIEPVFEDPEGDATDGASPGTDIKALYMARNENYLYFLVTLYGMPEPWDLRDTVYSVEASNFPGEASFGFRTDATIDSLTAHRASLLLAYFPVLTPVDVHQIYPFQPAVPLFECDTCTNWGYDSSTGEGWVEWKLPLGLYPVAEPGDISAFPLEALIGKYIGLWVSYPDGVFDEVTGDGVWISLD